MEALTFLVYMYGFWMTLVGLKLIISEETLSMIGDVATAFEKNSFLSLVVLIIPFSLLYFSLLDLSTNTAMVGAVIGSIGVLKMLYAFFCPSSFKKMSSFFEEKLKNQIARILTGALCLLLGVGISSYIFLIS